MRGIETGKVRIRHEVFTEIARMAYEGGDYAKRLEELPFKIIPGEIGSYRDSLFLERAVVGERLRQVSAALPGKAQVVCEDSLCGFYERCGFRRISKKYVAAAR